MENKKLEVIEGCVASNYPRTIYDNDEWAVFQNAYNEIFPEDAGIVGTYSFLFDYEVQDHPIRGRTIVTKEDLAPNAEIWWEEAWHCSFGEKQKFMSFLELLPSLAYQCEILLWAYVSKGKVSVELDPASFFNHADDEKMINMNSSSRPNRFIRAGEELLMNYSTFIEYDALPWFDKLRSDAWKETDSKSLLLPSKNENGKNAIDVYHSTKGYNLLGAPKQSQSQQKTSTKDTLLLQKKQEPSTSFLGLEEMPTIQPLLISLFPFTPLLCTIGSIIFVAVLSRRFFVRKKP
eukprot:CAMPEP_0194325368 /NCGR_PEP_ID=MMETSP0171-20130528/29984_1 /TAXON_ID=218684 /ORGANISM="Corethron pennatum, Strain L29A3" /LENGTH=290 /DNA_ID=CAMNT_0039084477 /DNA_START=52 /DNA_END=924 /DNA_ORIENTATION=-